ncbi:MAG: hypothetical protein HKN33_11485 [Pyrinomonadaceae bacterium]|nr:hypothetical protein [Pyrinomonadaceae bacterium]
MAEHVIAVDDAGSDLALCAAYIVEGITNAEAKSDATESVVDHFLTNGDVDSAAEFADALEDPYARDRFLIKVIVKCIEEKDDEYAFQLVEAISEPGLKATALEVTAFSLAERGEFEKAKETASGLDHSSDILAGIATVQAAKGLKEEAITTLGQIDYVKARVSAAIDIATAHFKDKNEPESTFWAAKAAEEVGDVEFEEDKIRLYNEIANLYLALDNEDVAALHFRAGAELAANLDNIHRDSLLVSGAIGLLKAGDVENADDTLDLVADKTQVAACLHGFSRYYEKEEPEDAVETIEEALAMLNSQSEYEVRSTKARNEMFGEVAVQFQRVGLKERALEIAHSNPDEARRNQALTSIAQLLLMDGDSAAADEVVMGIEPDSARLNAAIGLSDAAFTIEDKPMAVEYLRSAADLLEEVEQMIARAEISDEIAVRLGVFGESEEAEKLARANLRLISEIRNDGGKAAALVRLGSVYKKIGIELNEDDQTILKTLTRKVDW